MPTNVPALIWSALLGTMPATFGGPLPTVSAAMTMAMIVAVPNMK